MATSNLLKGLDQKDRDEVLRQLKYSVAIRAIREYLKQELSRLEYPSKDSYKDSAWAYKQADENGERRAYQKILKLLDHEEING